jgi:adenylate kinase family enzyme
MSTVYLFYGKSGCGKGTQVAILKERLEKAGKKIIYIEMGKKFRDLTETSDHFVGKLVKTTIEGGAMLPGFFSIYMWGEALINGYTGTEDIILDGATRLIEEAPFLDGALDFLNINERYLIHIDVSDTWVIDRMTARGRSDDNAEGMKKRIGWFTEKVVPVIEYFKDNNKYKNVIINGEQTIESVAADIKKEIHI